MLFTPQTLATASLYSQIGGALTSAVSGFYSAQLQETNLKMQADAAKANARLAELGAESALMQGHQEAANLTMKAGQLKARQRVSLAANGVDLGVGSAAEIQASTDIMKEIDRNTILSNAVKTAWGYRTQATNFQNQARMASGAASQVNPWASATGSLLSNAGSVADSWYRFNKDGSLKGTRFALE